LQYLEKGGINAKQKVLIYGASGTSGTMAIQIVKSIGAEVTGICSCNNIDFIKSLGADKVIDYTENDSILKLEKYDLILDSVGKSKTSKLKVACKKSLKENGRYISIDDGALILSSDRLDRICKLVENGNIRPINDKTFDFKDIIDAHRYVEGGHKRGNVAVKVNE